MMDIYPEFADQVTLYAVGQDPTETLEQLEGTRQQRGYTWPVAKPVDKMLANLRIFQESTKIAFDGDGVIVYRKRGGGDVAEWPRIFAELANNASR